jgi:hypothetical protein
MTGDQRRHAERVRDRHADKAGVERRRMDDHPVALQRRIETVAVGGRRGDERGERVVVHHHQKEEEHLNGGDDGHDIRNQLAVALAVHVDRRRPEDRQQEHPEHDRAVEPAPVRCDLVEERLDAVRVVRDVSDREVVGQEGVDDDRRRDGHQRGHEVKRADAALNQPARSEPCPGHRHSSGVTADDERGQ